MAKQTKSSLKSTNYISTSPPLELMHMGLSWLMTSHRDKSYVMSFVIRLRTDQGTEFENAPFYEFCDEKEIDQNFSAPITTQQNVLLNERIAFFST